MINHVLEERFSCEMIFLKSDKSKAGIINLRMKIKNPGKLGH